jgi:hypothetical protein
MRRIVIIGRLKQTNHHSSSAHAAHVRTYSRLSEWSERTRLEETLLRHISAAIYPQEKLQKQPV